MIVSIIVAADERGGIGYQNRVPWHIRSDLIRFRSLTMGHHILMGRKTYESIDSSLPGRIQVVITRQSNYHAGDSEVVTSLSQALEFAKRNGESEAFVIGGGDIFAQALPLTSRIYLTTVHTVARCDVFFPEIIETEWQVINVTHLPATERDDHQSTFKILERKNTDI